MSFEVKDVLRAVNALQARGVGFADYGLPGLKTVDKVCVLDSEKAGGFKIPAETSSAFTRTSRAPNPSGHHGIS